MPVPLRKEEYFTYGHYREWPEDERWELIEGVPYDMSPAPSPYHQEVLANLTTIINGKLKKGGKCKVYPAPFDVRLPHAAEPDDDILTVVQPDLSVVCDPSKIDERGCKGAPDFIIEILSPATAKRDMRDKLLLYERHGVREYWLVHPTDKLVLVYKLNKQKQYDREMVFSREEKISLVLKGGTLEINIEEVF